MKQFAALVLFSLVLGCLSCGDSGSSNDTSPADATVDQTSTDIAQDFAAEETVPQDGVDEDQGASLDSTDATPDEIEEVVVEPLGTYDCLRSPDCHRLIIVAHRGFHVTHPENSLAALRAAAEAGIPMAELDVRNTLDGALVLMHDDTVNRTTDGSGLVEEMTLEEIRALTLSKGNENVPESLGVPTFEEALEVAKETGLVLYVDQKTSRFDLVAAVIAEGDYYEQAMIRDGLGTIEQMAALDPDLLVMPAVEDTVGLDQAMANIPNLRIVELSQGDSDPQFGAYAYERGIKVQQDVIVCDLFATVEDYSCWESFVDAGVQVLQSDFAHVLVGLADNYNATGEW